MSTDDFSATLAEFINANDVPWARHQGQTEAAGRVASAGWDESTIAEAAIFPLDPRQMLLLPEGVREGGAIMVFVAPALLGGVVVTPGSERQADVIEWNGAVWQAHKVNSWHPDSGFAEVWCTKVSPPVATVAAFVELR